MNRAYLFVLFSALGLMTLFSIIMLLILPIIAPSKDQPPFFFSILMFLIFGWVWYAYLRIPFSITVQPDVQLVFRSALKQVSIYPNEIISIKTLPLTPSFINIKHNGGTIHLIAFFTGFYELIALLKTKNPDIEINGT